MQVRLFDVKTSKQAFGKEYTGSAANPRSYAHTISDEIHDKQRYLRGVARTKLTFDSDRDGERLGGTIESRSVKEIYVADYDGANQRRVTTGRSLNITPTWSPDGRSIAYTSYRRGQPNIFISNIYQGTLEELTRNPPPANNMLPAWSPDGKQLCFTSTRDGNAELYIVNRDGSNLRRLTNNPGADITPTWSPSGTTIAFTSDRSRDAADLLHRRRRPRPPEDHVGVLRRPADLVPGPVQRDRLRLADRPGLRHQGPGPRVRSGASADIRRGHERKPRLVAERPPSRLHVDAVRQDAGVRHRSGREEPEADHERRKQLPAGLV